MDTVVKQPQQKFKRREVRITSIYSRCLITRKIVLPITCIGKTIKEIIEENELDQINLTESDQVITEDVTKIETQSEVPDIIEVHEKFTEMDNMENFVNNESISDNISKIDEEEQKDFYQESKPISYRRGISL